MNATISFLKKHLLSALIIVVLLAGLAFVGGNSHVFAAPGSDPVNSSAPASVQSVGLSAPVQDGGGSSGSGVVTYSGGPAEDTWSPANRYLANGATFTLHLNLTAENAGKTSTSFDLDDATKITVVKAVTSVNGDDLSIDMSGGPTVTLTSDIGRPLGPIVLVTFKANTGMAGLIFGYSASNGVAVLTGPAFTNYNVKVNSVVKLGTTCYSYEPSDRTAPKATLTLLDSTNVSSATGYNGLELKPDMNGTVVTVSNPRGYALGGPVKLCLSAAAKDKPYGVPEQDLPDSTSVAVP